MAQAFKDEAERDAFLAEPRLAILISNRDRQAPIGVPVWFEWDGEQVLMFSAKGVAKIRRIEQDPRAMVLVTNHVGEDEAWVSFEGEMEILPEEDAWPLAERLARRYWDVEAKEDTLAAWEAAKDSFVLLRMKPVRIRTGH